MSMRQPIHVLSSIKEVLIYLRKSRSVAGMTEEESLDKHRDTLLDLCAKHGWKVIEIYEEVGTSDSIADREELPRMLDDIKRGCGAQAVVIMDLDRLSRNDFDGAVIRKVFTDHNILVVTPDQTIDLNDDQDSMIAGFYALLASSEYKMIKKRLHRGRMKSLESGRWVTGKPPYGYYIDPQTKHLKPDPDTVPVVQRIFKRISEGVTTIDMCLELNGVETPTSRGRGKWRNTTVSHIIRNRAYLGEITYGKIKNKKSRPKDYTPEDTWTIIEDAHPAIIDAETWRRANELLDRRASIPSKARAGIHGLSGIIKCGYCGRAMTVAWDRRQTDRRYVKGCVARSELQQTPCGNSGRKYEDTMEAIIEKFREYRDVLENAVRELKFDDRRFQRETADSREVIKAQLLKVERALERIEDAWEDGEYTKEEYKKRKARRQEERDSLSTSLRELEAKSSAKEISQMERLLSTIDGFLSDYITMSDKDINAVLLSCIHRIEWYNKDGLLKIKIIWKKEVDV